MTDRIAISHLYPGPLRPGITRDRAGEPLRHHEVKSFKEVLQEKEVKFSQHAEKRLQERGIHLKSDQLDKLESAIDKAAAKGAKDSLILLDDMALIVNIRNRTVITAINGTAVKENVFTKIDSAVIVT